MANQTSLKLMPGRAEMLRAIHAHDGTYDGVFFMAVRTTGIFCRPSCRPPRPPKPENLEFFGTVRECLSAGYRPCKLCRPDEARGTPPADIASLIRCAEATPERKFTAADLHALGLSAERVRRWFREQHGMTFAAWCRTRRLAEAFKELQAGVDLDDVALAHGFESHSGFREAFSRAFGSPPGRSRLEKDRPAPLWTAPFETPAGPMLAAANDAGVVGLEFSDRNQVATDLARMRRRFSVTLLPGPHPVLEKLGGELARYFSGELREFTVPLAPRGTPFQEKVWSELRNIPYAGTISYEELARRIGQPTARRAVARANGQNRIALLIPCHRVIGKDGSLTGYGGGVWRKRLLLELERTGRLPDGTGTEEPRPPNASRNAGAP